MSLELRVQKTEDPQAQGTEGQRVQRTADLRAAKTGPHAAGQQVAKAGSVQNVVVNPGQAGLAPELAAGTMLRLAAVMASAADPHLTRQTVAQSVAQAAAVMQARVMQARAMTAGVRIDRMAELRTEAAMIELAVPRRAGISPLMPRLHP